MVSDLIYGDVVQISPSESDPWAGCFLMVEEVTKNGVHGFIPAPKKTRYRHFRQWHEIDHVGHAVWQPLKVYEDD